MKLLRNLLTPKKLGERCFVEGVDYIVHPDGKYKYLILKPVIYDLPECFRGLEIYTPYVSIIDCKLLIKDKYAWDGASGAVDSPDFMRGSLYHDSGYQLIREGLLDKSYRKEFDKLLRQVCIEDGMSKFRAFYVYYAVCIFGRFSI